MMRAVREVDPVADPVVLANDSADQNRRFLACYYHQSFPIFDILTVYFSTVCLNEVGLNGAEKLADGFPGEVNVPRNVLEIYKT